MNRCKTVSIVNSTVLLTRQGHDDTRTPVILCKSARLGTDASVDRLWIQRPSEHNDEVSNSDQLLLPLCAIINC